MDSTLREIFLDKTICGRCGRKVSRREKKIPGQFPKCYKGQSWPTENATRGYPSTSSTQYRENAEFNSLRSFEKNQGQKYKQKVIEATQSELICECGLIMRDDWDGRGQYPFGNKSKEDLLDYGQRIAERLSDKGFEIDGSVLLDKLRENKQAGMADYENLSESVDYAKND